MKKKILVIEDEAPVATYLTTLLERAGYAVDNAGGCQEGLSMAAQNEYNLVLLDLGLPDGTGCDLIRELKQRSSCPPLLVVTGAAQGDPRIGEALKLGAVGCISKSSSVKSLLDAVERALGV